MGKHPHLKVFIGVIGIWREREDVSVVRPVVVFGDFAKGSEVGLSVEPFEGRIIGVISGNSEKLVHGKRMGLAME